MDVPRFLRAVYPPVLSFIVREIKLAETKNDRSHMVS